MSTFGPGIADPELIRKWIKRTDVDHLRAHGCTDLMQARRTIRCGSSLGGRVAPTALGAAAAGRIDARTPTQTSSTFTALDPSQGQIELRMFEFLERAVSDESASLQGVAVRVEGLVVNDPEVTDGFLLTKFMVSCCAADGVPLQVAVHGAGPLDDDTWVVADVVWRRPAVPCEEMPLPWVVEVAAVSVSVAAGVPNDPSESPY